MWRPQGIPGNPLHLILLVIIISAVRAEPSTLCDQGTFTCANGACVPEAKVNNSVNDCGDNSDEVGEPCRTPLFTCSLGAGHCTMMEFVLDGRMDCKDGSDEAKIIGTDCSMVGECCLCEDYVPDSECVHGGCACRSGFYPNTLGTTCTRRKVNDVCAVDADCYNAFNNSACVDGRCTCNMGFYPSGDATVCVARVVGDQCWSDADCTSVIPHGLCTRGCCVCASGYYRSEDRSTCIRRRVGENCTLQTDCTEVIRNSACVEEVCVCLGDNIPSRDLYNCRLPIVGDPCDSAQVCKYIQPISICRSDSMSCDCQHGFHTPRDPYVCVRRKLRDPCARDVDCSSAVESSGCRAGYCDCGRGYRNHPNRTYCVWAREPENLAAVTLSVFVICLLCFVLIATVPLLVYYFILYPKKKIPKLIKAPL